MPDNEGQDVLFRNARSHSCWLDEPVDDALQRPAYDLATRGPTSANRCPLGIILVKSREAKEGLKQALDAGNVQEVMTAPVAVIPGMEIPFYANSSETRPWKEKHRYDKHNHSQAR